MNVLVVLKTSEGGLWIIPQVEELQRRGHRVAVALPSCQGRLVAALGPLGVRVLDIAWDFKFRRPFQVLAAVRKLRLAVAETEADLVLYHLYASAIAVRVATSGMRVKRVHMVAGPLHLENRLIRCLESVMVRCDDLVVAGSRYTADKYRLLPLSRTPIIEIPYGVDCEAHQPCSANQRAANRTAEGLDRATFVAVMVAYVYPGRRSVFGGQGIKGHHVLLSAWMRFIANVPTARLYLVGGGFYAAGESERRRLINLFELSSSASVRWLDSVEDVGYLYSLADLSISPSLSENHGAALEAGAYAIPSIASDAGGLPEAVSELSGWVVPAGDVDALLDAIGMAYEEHRTGVLDAKGMHARRHVLATFNSRRCAVALAEALEGTVRT